MAVENLSFLSGVNAEYIAHLYSQFLKNPTNVDHSWQTFFNDLNDAEVGLLKELHGASWTPTENRKSANSFDEARELIAKESFDCILLDYLIGAETGLNFMQEIRPRLSKNTNVIMMTGYAHPELKEQTTKAGLSAFIAKNDLTEESLSRLISRFIKAKA